MTACNLCIAAIAVSVALLTVIIILNILCWLYQKKISDCFHNKFRLPGKRHSEVHSKEDVPEDVVIQNIVPEEFIGESYEDVEAVNPTFKARSTSTKNEPMKNVDSNDFGNLYEDVETNIVSKSAPERPPVEIPKSSKENAMIVNSCVTPKISSSQTSNVMSPVEKKLSKLSNPSPNTRKKFQQPEAHLTPFSKSPGQSRKNDCLVPNPPKQPIGQLSLQREPRSHADVERSRTAVHLQNLPTKSGFMEEMRSRLQRQWEPEAEYVSQDDYYWSCLVDNHSYTQEMYDNLTPETQRKFNKDNYQDFIY